MGLLKANRDRSRDTAPRRSPPLRHGDGDLELVAEQHHDTAVTAVGVAFETEPSISDRGVRKAAIGNGNAVEQQRRLYAGLESMSLMQFARSRSGERMLTLA